MKVIIMGASSVDMTRQYRLQFPQSSVSRSI